MQGRPDLPLALLLLLSLASLQARPRSRASFWDELGVGAEHGRSRQCPAPTPLESCRASRALVATDQQTDKRTFEARIVGIFPCEDADSTRASNDLSLDYKLAKPAIDLAVELVNEKFGHHMHFNVTYKTASNICKHQQAAGYAADEFYVNGASFFVGPGCSESLASVGQLASYWNVPMCSTGYLPDVVTARFKPLTLMQLSLSVQSVGEMLMSLCQKYGWRHLVIVTDEKHPLHSLIRDGLLEFFNTIYLRQSQASQLTGGGSPSQTLSGPASRLPYSINITSRSLNPDSKQDSALGSSPSGAQGRPEVEPDFKQVMLDAAAYSRIMLLLARSSTIVSLLEAAHSQGMSRGQFVFIAHELFETQTLNAKSADSSQPSRNRFAFDDKIEIQARNGNASAEQLAREIFQPLMTISLRIPTTAKFDSFRSDVAARSEGEFNYRIQSSSLKSLYSLGVAAFIYDCIMLYADRVNFILSKTKFTKLDGKTIFDLSAGYTFSDALTGNLTLNRAGQRVIDFTLNDFSADSLSLEPIAHFMAIERRLEFLASRKPHWAARNQSAPPSDPRCRPYDLHCQYAGDNDQSGSDESGSPLSASAYSNRVVLGVWLLSIIVISVALTSSIIGWPVYRHRWTENELLNKWWAIKYEDIIFEDEAEPMCDGKRSMSSLAISNESFNERLGANPAQPEAPKGVASAHSQAQQQVEVHGQQLAVSEPSQGGHLSAAHSTSTLSVGAPNSLAASQSTLAAEHRAQQGAASGPTAQLPGTSAACAPKTSPTNKLIPLISKSASAGSRTIASSGAQLGPHSGGKAGSRSGAAPANKDPSISSQNKNAKLRLGTVLNGARDEVQTTKVGLYKASRVAVKHLNIRNPSINRQCLIELRQVRDLTHENLIKFIGLCHEEPVAIVSELCTRGNLQDLLQNETIRLDWPFRYSIINDIVDGLIHLHSSPIQYHGRLKSSNCVIDNRFVVKLTDFGLPTLLAAVEDEESINPRLLLWTAPEHLRTKRPLLSGSQKGDIYGLAIIFQEIITRCGPFECEPILCGANEVTAGPITEFWQQAPGRLAAHQPPPPPLIRTTMEGGSPRQRNPHSRARLAPAPAVQPLVVQHKQRLEPDEIVNLVRMGLSPPFRPYFRPDVAASAGASSADFNVSELIAMVQNCWQESPSARPNVASIKQQIKKMRRGCHLEGANLMDNLLQRMERYTDNLESLVEQKTAELMEEKKRSEELLYEMLPRFVVDQLKYGHSVTPEAYEAVTISFSDIKDFTSIAAQSSPIEVVNLLNQLYTEFDDCIARYDVYKVETIGDAYMVVSGLPVRNGDLHAKEIAEMSLALLELIRNFEVAHLPHVKLELRIGIHSGPCASGVVGTRMFRYCLFGDTVSFQAQVAMVFHELPVRAHPRRARWTI